MLNEPILKKIPYSYVLVILRMAKWRSIPVLTALFFKTKIKSSFILQVFWTPVALNFSHSNKKGKEVKLQSLRCKEQVLSQRLTRCETRFWWEEQLHDAQNSSLTGEWIRRVKTGLPMSWTHQKSRSVRLCSGGSQGETSWDQWDS